MQARLILWHLALTLCCSCAAREPGSDAAPTHADDASALARDADVPPGDASITSGAADGAANGALDAGLDGARPATPNDAAASPADAGSDPADAACSGESCSPQASCDEDHPCRAADTVCVAHACRTDPEAPAAAWARSPWSGRVGRVGEDDTTLWCTPSLTAATAATPARVSSQLDRVALDSSQQAALGDARVAQRVRVQCFADASLGGPSTLVTSSWSVDAAQDVVSARCPGARPHAAFARCQLATQDKPPLVYAGPSCGAGVAGLMEKPWLRGQLIGDHYELSTPGRPLFNNTGKAAVMGTDLGFQFLAQGRMYLGFGDTWENELSLAGPNGYRGSILAYTHDFDPADDNGIAIEGWETAPERANVAREVIHSVHDSTGASEFTAIATAGFGLSDGGAHYRFLWFAAIKQWSPFVNNESTLAWSKDGGTFTRGDQAAATPAHPPRWPFQSFFGPGACWVDREHGYVYFIGVRTYQPGFPLRLARVRATLAAVLDSLQYEYWTGSAWQRPDPNDEYALTRLAAPAADLVPGNATQNSRPEISVAYNPYVGRFLMLLQNDSTPFTDEADTKLQLWQAEAIEGPWQLVDSGDRLVLPPHHYGPYMSEQTFSEGGRDVSFALSEWNLLPLSLGQPYVVGLWNMRLERQLRPGCEP
jgi:hypothetical protein